jgi:hypothetical protein
MSSSATTAAMGDRTYTIFLVLIALSGWTLASYDFNLLVLTFPDISKSLNLRWTPSAGQEPG